MGSGTEMTDPANIRIMLFHPIEIDSGWQVFALHIFIGSKLSNYRGCLLMR